MKRIQNVKFYHSTHWHAQKLEFDFADGSFTMGTKDKSPKTISFRSVKSVIEKPQDGRPSS